MQKEPECPNVEDFLNKFTAYIENILPDLDKFTDGYKDVIEGFFERGDSLEVIILNGSKMLREDKFGKFYGHYVWYPIEAIAERLSLGEKPDSFKKIFYTTMEKLAIDNSDPKYFRQIFPYNPPVDDKNTKPIQFDYFKTDSFEQVMDILNDKKNTENMTTLTNALYNFVGPEHIKTISLRKPTDMQKCEFAHCARIAKNADKLSKNKSSQKFLVGAFIGRALSALDGLPTEDEEGYDRKITEAYQGAVDLANQSQVLMVESESDEYISPRAARMYL